MAGERGGSDSPENKELTSVLLPENLMSPGAAIDSDEAAEAQEVKAKTAREKLSDIWRQAGEDATRLHDEHFDPNATYEGTPGGDENTTKSPEFPDALLMNRILANAEREETLRHEEAEAERKINPNLSSPELEEFKSRLNGPTGSPFEGRWTEEKNLKLLRDLERSGMISVAPQERIIDTLQMNQRQKKRNLLKWVADRFTNEGFKTGGSFAFFETFKVKDHADSAFVMTWEEAKSGNKPIGWSVVKLKEGQAFTEKDGNLIASDKLREVIKGNKFESAVNKQWISSTPPASGRVYADIQTPHDTLRSVAGRNTAARNSIFKDIDHGNHQTAARTGEAFAMPAAPRPAAAEASPSPLEDVVENEQSPTSESERPVDNIGQSGNFEFLGEVGAPGEYRYPANTVSKAEDILEMKADPNDPNFFLPSEKEEVKEPEDTIAVPDNYEPAEPVRDPIYMGERLRPGVYDMPSEAYHGVEGYEPAKAWNGTENILSSEIDGMPLSEDETKKRKGKKGNPEATSKRKPEPKLGAGGDVDSTEPKIGTVKDKARELAKPIEAKSQSVIESENISASETGTGENLSKKEYSVSHEGDDYSAFSMQVHRIQDGDETFGVPDSGQFNQLQVKRLAEGAATLEELQTLRNEIDQREKQAGKDDRLFETRIYGQDNDREVQVPRTREAREIELILYKRRQQLVDEARGHGSGVADSSTHQEKIRARDKDAEIENIAWVRKQENLLQKVKGSQDNAPETLESRDEDVRNNIERVRNNTRKAHVEQIVGTIEKFKNGTLDENKPDKLLRDALADAIGSGLLKKEPKKPFEVVSTGSELSDEIMTALSGIETKEKKEAAGTESPQENGEPEPDIHEINRKLDELKAAARETSPEVSVEEGAKVEPDIHEINRKLDELKNRAVQESGTDELMAEVDRLAESDPSRVDWDDRWNDIYDRTIESGLAVSDADSVSGLGVITGSAESEEIVNKIGDVYEDVLRAGDLLEQIRQVNLAHEDETRKAEQLRSLFEQVAEEGFAKVDLNSQPYGVSLPAQPTAAARTFMSGLEKAYNPEIEDGAPDEGAENSLDERIGQALNDGAGQPDWNDRRRRGRGRR
ncbi:MAG: hypothetical protein NVSMB39_6320 [Candidatus Saccharimonadales bacterium]